MLYKFAILARSFWYWATLIILGLATEALALVYQYAWDHAPCEDCIYIRIWLFGVIFVAGFGLWLRRFGMANLLLHGLNSGLAYGMLVTSRRLLGTERGTLFGGCGLSLDLPSWFALDQWFPALFGVWGACGKTPELLFGVTMAEGLVVLSWGLLLLSATLLAVQLTAILSKGR